ncbi:TadE/TadG family type IV pilus assembly protein [Methylocystis sp. ATCC 49242]|uniref:TadE/TadG family type IV pilus assembly protein n=1 Tax=Methylocystis sp. ATCC 49242 TaxID=622637 RepID=UPI0001F86A31|nr:VWA domain-containing protein [Methylocystis sp. ATCC 49242]
MKRPVNEFVSDHRGNVVMLFGLSVIPVMMMAGAAVDYARGVTTHKVLQQGADTAALAVASRITAATSTADAIKQAQNVLRSASQRLAAATISNATISADRKTFCIDAQVSIPTMIMKIARIDSMAPAVMSCAEIGGGSTNYEIALALDNSGSMNESAGGATKIQSLKTAATNFVNSMFAKSPGKVKIAITPFAGLVIPVDPTVAANRALPWIDVNGLSSQHWITFGGKANANAAGFTSRFNVFSNLKSQRADWDFGGCYEPQPYPMNVTETAPTAGNAETLFVPYLAPDEPDSSAYENNYLNDDGGGCSLWTFGGWTDLTRTCKYKPATGWTSGIWSWFGATAGNGWTGGVFASRGGAFNGPNGMCPNAATQTALQLTPTQSTITAKIAQLTAAGDTNLHEGVMWAWRSISPNPPFSAGSAYNTAGVRKILVLMTDGYNNWTSNTNTVGGSYYEALGYYSYNGAKNRRLPDGTQGNGVDYQSQLDGAANSWTDYKSVSRQAQDELTRQSCENAKAKGIEIYSIAFSVSTNPIDAAGINLLKSCATNADHYLLATDSTQIDRAFSQIAMNLSKLRLSR